MPRPRACSWLLTALSVVVCLARAADAGQAVSPEVLRLAESGRRAIEERRYAEALAAFESADRLAPRTPAIVFGLGYSAFLLGQRDVAERHLERVLQIDTAFTDASVLLGLLQHSRGRIQDAIATYEAALKHAPGNAVLVERLAEWSKEARAESRFAETRGAHFRVLFEGPVDQALARRAVELLEGAYLRIGSMLGVYPPRTVEVVLYTDQQFRDITRGPSWAGGVYDGRIRVPVKGALEQRAELDRVLTHEYVHALVASLTGRVPAWLNEGLAVLLEPGGLAAAERDHARGGRRPALTELHADFGEMPASEVRMAYAESTLAARAMLDLRGPSAVVMLLRDLGAGASFATAFHQRIGIRYEEFQAAISRR